MIRFEKLPIDDNGQPYPNLAAAQKAEIASITGVTTDMPPLTVIEAIVAHADAVVDVLTMTPTSKPRARAIHGGKKTRKPKDNSAAVNAALQDGKQ